MKLVTVVLSKPVSRGFLLFLQCGHTVSTGKPEPEMPCLCCEMGCTKHKRWKKLPPATGVRV